MRVSEVMTKDVATCRPDEDTSTAAGIMWERDCGCVPVVDESGRVAGMITDRDICMAAYTRGLPLHDITVASVMTTDLTTCREDDEIDLVEARMASAQVRRLPVLDSDDQVRGVVSLNDLARARAERGRNASDGVTRTLAAIGTPRADAPS